MDLICQILRKIKILKIIQIFWNLDFAKYALFLIRNSYIRNFYWDGQIAKKLSVLKPQRLRNFLIFFGHFFIVILKIRKLIMVKTCLEKHLSAVQTLKMKQNENHI